MSRAGLYLICLVVGLLPGLSGFFFRPGEWYFHDLDKPSWTPPPWIFAPVWTTIYVCTGVVLARLLMVRGALADPHSKMWTIMPPGMAVHVRGLAMRNVTGAANWALLIFALQWICNCLWSPLFFGLQSPLYGLIDIAILWMLLRRAIGMFWRLDRVSSYLFIPYILWVSFATLLNATIFRLNLN